MKILLIFLSAVLLLTLSATTSLALESSYSKTSYSSCSNIWSKGTYGCFQGNSWYCDSSDYWYIDKCANGCENNKCKSATSSNLQKTSFSGCSSIWSKNDVVCYENNLWKCGVDDYWYLQKCSSGCDDNSKQCKSSAVTGGELAGYTRWKTSGCTKGWNSGNDIGCYGGRSWVCQNDYWYYSDVCANGCDEASGKCKISFDNICKKDIMQQKPTFCSTNENMPYLDEITEINLEQLPLFSSELAFLRSNNFAIFFNKEKCEKIYTSLDKDTINIMVRYLQILPKNLIRWIYVFQDQPSSKYSSGNICGSAWQGCGDGMILNSDCMIANTIIHEAGHNLQFSRFGVNFKDGKLKEFSDISWILKDSGFIINPELDTDTKPDTVNYQGFVSDYSMTAPAEDFAETFSYYMIYSEYFRYKLQYDKILKVKYEWMKNNVFDGREYDKSPNPLDNAMVYSLIGEYWNRNKDYNKALTYYRKALSEYNIIIDKYKETSISKYATIMIDQTKIMIDQTERKI